MKSSLREDVGFYRTSRFDVIFIILIVLLSVILILRTIRGYTSESSESTVALVYREGELVEELDLEKERTIALDGGEIEIEEEWWRQTALEASALTAAGSGIQVNQ